MNVTKAVVERADILRRDWNDDEDYYRHAEEWVNTCWDLESRFPFREMFNRLDSSVIVELACGRGRHSWQMRDWPNQKILVDLVPDNIAFCRKRFAGLTNFQFIVNNGIDLREIADGAVTAVFCYDAMVHFDHEIVYAYLREFKRILRPGGMALLHHSNYPHNPGGDYKGNPHWRCFMPAGLFRDYAIKTGLEVVEQRCFAWGDVADIDCLSLVAKPESPEVAPKRRRWRDRLPWRRGRR
ncbi:methyltransferase domain-containing protein [Rhodoblastus acidophilus]|uniref:Methyltransferase domain-containing protein n=1 Tax=Rhodoblastus acidophilus TaxID=1074 RepID=A0A6N8DL13_RHOAC|nr:class I SAM-dependent methyltransferase [Rhodoblastus acidophilus]MCW2272991.1 SAM-dependent methyltransferase [Rhodoblastus acidophilus]MTV29893.1 methyltransferase domain-containing protein [Rhodoblastus acidophilus]